MLLVEVINSGDTFVLPDGEYSFGRGKDNFIVLNHPSVSRKHFLLYKKGSEWIIEDLGSTNGTFIGGKRIIKKDFINEKAIISAGNVMIKAVIVNKDDVIDSQILKKPIILFFEDETREYTLEKVKKEEFEKALKEFFIKYEEAGDFFSSDLPTLFEKSGIEGFGIAENNKNSITIEFIWGEFPKEYLIKKAFESKMGSFSKEDEKIYYIKKFKILDTEKYGFVVLKENAMELLLGLKESLISLLKFIALSIENYKTITTIDKEYYKIEFPDFIVISEKMRKIKKLIEERIGTKTNVLLEGETGTGKEVIARYIHEYTNKESNFVPIDLNSIPSSLLESELFGHTKGAFTGAISSKTGIIEAADGGTLFLDEIENLPLELQSKLLRVLETKEFIKLGATMPKKAEFRIIAASQVPFKKLVEEGKLRKDFYYRIKTIVIKIPPLRERKEEIIPLFEYYIEKFARRENKKIKGITPKAIEILKGYSWPGNIRELKNEAEKCVTLLKDNGVITADVLSEEIREEAEERKEKKSEGLLEKKEKEVVISILKETNWNKTKAAEILGITRAGLIKKLKRWGIM